MSVQADFEQELQLLATMVGSGAHVHDATTALVLALTEQQILLEANRTHEKGEAFTLRFFVPLNGSFSRLSLQCVITEIRDLEKLQYQADITDLDESQRTILSDYLAETQSRQRP